MSSTALLATTRLWRVELQKLQKKWHDRFSILRIVGETFAIPFVRREGSGNEIGCCPQSKYQSGGRPCQHRPSDPFDHFAKIIRTGNQAIQTSVRQVIFRTMERSQLLQLHVRMDVDHKPGEEKYAAADQGCINCPNMPVQVRPKVTHRHRLQKSVDRIIGDAAQRQSHRHTARSSNKPGINKTSISVVQAPQHAIPPCDF